MGNKLSQEEVRSRVKDFFIQDVELISNYIGKRHNIKLRCNNCGTEWGTVASNVIYSSRTGHKCPHCRQKRMDELTKVVLQCAYCGKEFVRAKRLLYKSRSGYFYCCQEHCNRHRQVLREEKGEFDDSKNYRRRAFSNFPPRCAVCHWVEDERILEVHHKDSDRNNNKVENLIILCPNCHRKITLGYYWLDESQGVCLRSV